MTISYRWLYDMARGRFSSEQAFESYLPVPKTADELRATGDHRYLSMITRRVFRAGMTHAVVDGRWPAFEQAFWGFVPEKLVLLSPQQIEQFSRNKALIRHSTKMRTIPQNAQLVLDLAAQYGSVGEFLVQWPDADLPGLWRYLAAHGARLGGNSAAAFLRMAGRDSFIMTTDVCAALASHQIIDTRPSTKAAQVAAQRLFAELQQASGRPQCQLSAMLALTINPRF